MVKYAFASIPLHGHVNYTLPLVQELLARGEQVVYYLKEDFRHTIEAVGARFIPNLAPIRAEATFKEYVQQGIEVMRVEQPDFIIYDYMTVWAPLVARALHIPAIGIRGIFAMNEHFDMLTMRAYESQNWPKKEQEFLANPQAQAVEQKYFESVCAAIDIAPSAIPALRTTDMYKCREPLNISFIPRFLQPAEETFDEHYHFLGSSIFKRPYEGSFPFEKLDDRPLIYISLGTLFSEKADIFKACVKGFGNTPWQVLLTRGQKNIRFAMGPIPANMLIATYVPQLEILPRTSVFVTHAGLSSVIESLYYGVPMVTIPLIPEHAIAADRLQELGLGIALNPETVTAEKLRAAVVQIMGDPGFYKRAQEMQKVVHNAGGYKRGVDLMLQLAQQQIHT